MNKIFELIISKKLSYLMKHHDWLFAAQMKTWLNKLTKIVLKFLTEQMHMMWRIERNKIMTLLNINVAKNFSVINHVKLIYNFCKKNIQLNHQLNVIIYWKLKYYVYFHKLYHWKRNYMYGIITKIFYVIHIIFVFQRRFARIGQQIENKNHNNQFCKQHKFVDL